MIDYAALYGVPIQPEIVEAKPTKQTKTGRRSGQQSSRKHAALEKFQLAHNFAVGGMRLLRDRAANAWWILWSWSTDGIVKMSHLQLAEQMGKCEKTAERSALELEDAGFVTVLTRGGKRIGPSTYQLHPISIHGDKIVPVEQTPLSGTT